MGVASIALPPPVRHYPAALATPRRQTPPRCEAAAVATGQLRSDGFAGPPQGLGVAELGVAGPDPGQPDLGQLGPGKSGLRGAGAVPSGSAATLTTPPLHTSAGGRVHRTPEQLAEQDAIARQIRRCLAGDAEAWQQLVGTQHRRVYAVCYRFTGSAADSEDLTQEAFLKIYTHLASFDQAKGSFQTWSMTLTRNLLVDHFRRTRLQRATDSLHASADGDPDSPMMIDQLADPRAGQEQHIAGQELRVRVQAALKQLSPELREAVILRDLEDLDYREIAQVLRIPEGTVKSRISRGRGELARLLQRTEGQVV